MHRRKLWIIISTIVALTTVVFIQASIVVSYAGPKVYDWVDRSLAPVQAVCGCSLSELSVHPIVTAFSAVAIAVIAVWLVAALSKLFFIKRSTYILVKAIRKRVVGKTIVRGISVYQFSSDTQHAITVGWFRPAVYISQATINRLTAFELLALIQHEVSHAQHRDPLWRAIFFAIVPWLTSTSSVMAQFHTWQEVAADEAADSVSIQSAYVQLAHTPALAVGANYFAAEVTRTYEDRRMDYWLGSHMRLGELRWVYFGLITMILSLSIVQVVVASEIPEDVIQSCQQVEIMCNEIMSRPAMSLPQ